MRNRTGLAAEAAAQVKNYGGIRTTNRVIGGVEITDTKVPEAAAKKLGMKSGRYISIEASPKGEVVCALLKRGLEQLIPASGTVLVAGIGNADITQDSLGPRAVSLMTPEIKRRYRIKVAATTVTAKTGIDTAVMLKSMIQAAKADFVIVIDSLACEDLSHVGRTVQITDAGIVPGAGASAAKGELSEDALGVPCIAVGVPTVTELTSVTNEVSHKGLLVSTADCDVMICQWAEVIAVALKFALR